MPIKCPIARAAYHKEHRRNGETPKIKAGRLKRQRNYYDANKATVNERARKVSRVNPERSLFNSAKGRAKHKNIPFSVTIADIIVPEKCPYLGTKLVRGKGRTDASPSLDRIDNAKGYIPGNVEVISHRANTLKRDGTAFELAAIAARMAELGLA